MKGLPRIFFTGMLISFLGTLPLSTLNITAMQISLQESVKQAMYFSLGALLIEMVYVRISLVGIDWIRKQQRLMRMLEWFTLLIVLALSIGSFYAATQHAEAKNALIDNDMHRFLFGMSLSAINPMQIPFWFGWSTVLFSKNVLKPIRQHYNVYIFGIGLGTFIGNCLFIYGGKFVANKLNANQNSMNWIVGSIFAVTALIQAYRLFFTKSKFEEESIK